MIKMLKKAVKWYVKMYTEVYKYTIEAGVNPTL